MILTYHCCCLLFFFFFSFAGKHNASDHTFFSFYILSVSFDVRIRESFKTIYNEAVFFQKEIPKQFYEVTLTWYL